jgi:hypothetical protein
MPTVRASFLRAAVPSARPGIVAWRTHDARVEAAQVAMSRVPTDHQDRRIKVYAAGMHIKHWEFAHNVLDGTVGDDPEAKFHTFHIERSNNDLRSVHSRNTRSSTELYRCFARLSTEATDRHFR